MNNNLTNIDFMMILLYYIRNFIDSDIEKSFKLSKCDNFWYISRHPPPFVQIAIMWGPYE